MTDYQTQLMEKLEAKTIDGKWNGNFLNCRVKITAEDTGKIKWQKFSFVFDSADDCQGSRIIPRSLKGAYCEHFAGVAAAVIVDHSNEIAAVPV